MSVRKRSWCAHPTVNLDDLVGAAPRSKPQWRWLAAPGFQGRSSPTFGVHGTSGPRTPPDGASPDLPTARRWARAMSDLPACRDFPARRALASRSGAGGRPAEYLLSQEHAGEIRERPAPGPWASRIGLPAETSCARPWIYLLPADGVQAPLRRRRQPPTRPLPKGSSGHPESACHVPDRETDSETWRCLLRTRRQ